MAERFWAKVQIGAPTACWPWQGATFHFGHGAFKVGGRPWGAHRIAWQLDHDEEVPEGLNVLHHCDNPPCCNPAHLYLGSQLDNVHDMTMRNRQHARLTPSQVWTARRRAANGARFIDLAHELGVAPTTMASALHGRTWAHLPDPVPLRYRRRPKRRAAVT